MPCTGHTQGSVPSGHRHTHAEVQSWPQLAWSVALRMGHSGSDPAARPSCSPASRGRAAVERGGAAQFGREASAQRGGLGPGTDLASPRGPEQQLNGAAPGPEQLAQSGQEMKQRW